MMKIKSYLDFINEEVVVNLKKIPFKDQNFFKDIFNNEPLKLKFFLQENMPNQNFKYLGAGGFGLSFEWIKSKPLPNSFFNDNFFGKNIESGSKVLKFTANKSEAEGTKKMIKLSDGGQNKIPGFANYFWIKQVNIPEKNWWSVELGPQRPDQITKNPLVGRGGKEMKSRKGDYMKDRGLEDLSGKEIKSGGKTKMGWIICLEKLRMLTERETILCESSKLFLTDPSSEKLKTGFLDFKNHDIDKIKTLYDWYLSDDNDVIEFWKKKNFTIPEYHRENMSYWKELFKKTKPNFEEFNNFCISVSKIFSNGLRYDIPLGDIKSDNMGFRGGELVAFDCM